MLVVDRGLFFDFSKFSEWRIEQINLLKRKFAVVLLLVQCMFCSGFSKETEKMYGVCSAVSGGVDNNHDSGLTVVTEKINEKQVIEQTIQNNQAIKEAYLVLKIAEVDHKGSLSPFFPKVDFVAATSTAATTSSSHRFKNSGLLGYQQKQGSARDDYYGLKINWELFSGFSDYHNVKARTASVEIARKLYKKTITDAVCESKGLYANLMYAYERIELLKKIRDRYVKSRDFVKLRYSSGKIDISSVKIAEADIINAEYMLREAQRSVESISASLLHAIGRDSVAVILATDERIVFSRKINQKPDFNRLAATNPEILIEQDKVNIQKARLAQVNSCWFPKLTLEGTVAKRFEKWKDQANYNDMKLQLTLPVFTGLQRYCAVLQAKNELKKSYEILANKINSLKASMIRCYNDLISAYEYFDVKKSFMDASSLQVEISAKKYAMGFLMHRDWYDVEQNYSRVQEKLLDAKQLVAANEIRWCKLIGKDFSDNK